jgi:hypothetical protein
MNLGFGGLRLDAMTDLEIRSPKNIRLFDEVTSRHICPARKDSILHVTTLVFFGRKYGWKARSKIKRIADANRP